MTTPVENSVGVTFFDPRVLGNGRFVAGGVKWGDSYWAGPHWIDSLGKGVTLDFSFQTRNSYYQTDYSPYKEYDDNSGFLTTGEKASIRTALATWSSFANVTFREVTDSYDVAGDIRFGYTSRNDEDLSAHAYYPSDKPRGGDVWFDWSKFNPKGLPTIARGSIDYLIILHEIGHALGLKHSFESPNAIPAAQDNLLYSIMSYTASPWSAHGNDFATFYPTTPMFYDLLAFEGMYGRRSFATGNDTYVFRDGTRYWQAIHDTGGNDTIRYVGTENSSINLNPGAFSDLSEEIRFKRPDGTAVSTRGTVTIGPGVQIENAIGGGGNDRLAGNGAANTLAGGTGADTLIGAAGDDTLDGGAGADTLTGGAGADELSGGAGIDRLIGGDGDDTYLLTLDADTINDTAGIDTIESTVGRSLAGFTTIENLILLGAAGQGTGNALANTIIGNSARNILDGGAGADSMQGGRGNDTYVVDNARDVVIDNGFGDVDTINSTISFSLAASWALQDIENLTLVNVATALNGTGNHWANVITGNNFDNTLIGGGGGDTLRGGYGNDTLHGYRGDTLIGGPGNDTYVLLTEGYQGPSGFYDISDSAGIDTATSPYDVRLTSGGLVAVENLTLQNFITAYAGIGNDLANVITGNSFSNYLSGGAGSDTLRGGDDHDSLAGNEDNDVLLGGNHRDWLQGDEGVDTLTGGADSDTFIFDVDVTVANKDVITDFANSAFNDDIIHLDNAVMPKLGGSAGALNPAFFRVGTVAADADDFIVYNQTAGVLYYDSNGNLAGGAVPLATLTNKPTLTAADFLVV